MREAGEALARETEAQLARVRAAAQEVSRRPRTVFVWGRGGRTMQVSGRGTAAEAMMDLIHADNAVRDFEGYRPLTPEALISAEPEVLVIDEALLDRLGGVPGLSRDPALASTPAVRNGRVVPVHVLSFIGFGPRTGEVALDALRRVHGLETDGPESRP
jgi:iron complex transport system substrate-binding protein